MLVLVCYLSSTVTPPGEQQMFSARHLLHCAGSITGMPAAYDHLLSIVGVSTGRRQCCFS